MKQLNSILIVIPINNYLFNSYDEFLKIKPNNYAALNNKGLILNNLK